MTNDIAAEFRFYGELNDFLLQERRGHAIRRPLAGRQSVKDALEALGVPHPEVDLLLVDGESVGFNHILSDGNRIAAYPRHFSLDVAALSRVRVPDIDPPRFILDVHLGKLTRFLRLLGYDARAGYVDAEIARITAEEGRIVLTRDMGLLKRSIVTRGRWVRATHPPDQCREVVTRYGLSPIDPFSRCLECNGLLVVLTREEAAQVLKPGIVAAFDDFGRCTGCGRLYWPGSHFDRLDERIAAIFPDRARP